MSRPPQVQDLYAVLTPQDPALHPDGSLVVFALSHADRDQDAQLSELWTLGTEGGEPRRLTKGPADAQPTFSPDGSRLAFLRGGDGPAQLWLFGDGLVGEPRPLTELTWGAGTPVWSPDGTRIAFAAPVSPNGLTPAEHGTAPLVADDIGYQADGSGLIGGLRQQIHVLEVATGTVTRLTDGSMHAAGPVWDHTGDRLFFALGSGPDADLTLTTTTHVVEVAAAGSVRALHPFTDYEVPVCCDQDTGDLICAGSERPGVGHATLWVRDVEGTTRQDVTGHLDRNLMTGGPGYPGAAPVRLGPDDLLVCVRDQGYSHLHRLGPEGDTVLVGGTTSISGMSVSRGSGTAAVIVSTPDTFGEVALLDLGTGALRELTAYRDGVLAELDWVTPAERTFTAPDGRPIHGWLIRRPDLEGPGPLLLDIHGGPHNAWSGVADSTHLYHQVLAAAGWGVLILNPRGSDGYGEDFYLAAAGQWGTADSGDFLAPLDELVADGIADPAKLAVTGYSYGGYMTCYLTAHDDRFAAAVPGGVVVDGRSIATTSDLGPLLSGVEMGALPWTDGAHLDASSPIRHVDQVRTPTLILHGSADLRCPVSEAQRWFASLRALKVPTRLVLYPGSSHLFILGGRPSHRADYNSRVVDWVHRYTKDSSTQDSSSVDHARPAAPPLDAARWQTRLRELSTRDEVPGAALGILRLGGTPGGDEVVTTAHGVLSQQTGLPVEGDSVFQIGSITKVWTATLAMQLVGEGLLDLDAPVRDVLPELRLGSEEVAAGVTVRHLLTHTSGIDGDIFTDTGRGDDVLARYVEELAGARQLHPLGETFSYCNSGFNLLGRVIEKITGQTWDTALRERIITPLGLRSTGTLPEDALLHGAALGHERDDDGQMRPASVWGIPRSSGPAGLINASVRDVLEFAAMHLRGGVAADGTRVLAADVVAQMQTEQVRLPSDVDLGDSWGLGWIRFDWGGSRLIGHDGNTIGQSAFLRLLPGEGLAVVLLTNGGNTRDLFGTLYGEIFRELADVEIPAPLEPSGASVDLSDVAARYERAAERIDVGSADGTPTLTSTALEAFTDDNDPVSTFDLHGLAERTALIRHPGQRTWSPVTFYRSGGRRYVHHHLRATPEVVDTDGADG